MKCSQPWVVQFWSNQLRKSKYTASHRWKALMLAVLLLVFSVFALYKVRTDVERVMFPRTYREIVEEQAEVFDLPESLVYAVIKAESNFDTEAVSSVGAIGLMQMMPNTFTWMQEILHETYEEKALYEPEVSVRFGCALLRLLLNEYGDLTAALSAYNAGMGNVTSWLSDTAYSTDGETLSTIPFSETRMYVKKVLRYKANYEKIYGGMENG